MGIDQNNLPNSSRITTIVHDLKGPITSMSLKLQLASRAVIRATANDPTLTRVESLLGGIRADLERMTAIIDSLDPARKDY